MKQEKILIIEDNPDLRTIYTLAFSQAGYTVDSSEEGSIGIQKAASMNPDVILLDIMMPNMDGLEVIEGLRQNTNLDCLILIISNLVDDKIIKEAYRLGVTDYINKSELTPQQVIQRVKDYLRVDSMDKPGQMNGYAILIIEDNEDEIDLLTLSLEQKNCHVYASNNGFDGITKAVEIQPDAILLDILMPDMDGFEVIKNIKGNAKLNTPVFVTSNLNQQKDVKKAESLGVDAFMKKSEYTPEQIAEEVIDFLDTNT